MKPKKHLSFGSLRNFMSNHIKEYPDWRQGNKSAYSIHDGVMTGLVTIHFWHHNIHQNNIGQYLFRCYNRSLTVNRGENPIILFAKYGPQYLKVSGTSSTIRIDGFLWFPPYISLSIISSKYNCYCFVVKMMIALYAC